MLKRRDFFRLGLTGMMISGLGLACKNDNGTGPSKPPEPLIPPPVYDLSDGFALYDDFDGNGSLQSYDNQNLAVAGALSSKLWLAGQATDVVLDPTGGGLFTVVNEDGQKVEYGLQERQVQDIVAYLDDHSRPVTAFEREVLENLVTHRGKTVIADVETKEIDKQVKVIQYLLNNRLELFNERGRKLSKMLSAHSTSDRHQETLAEIAKQGFDDRELLVLGRLMAEKRIYENYRDSPIGTVLRKGESVLRTAIGRRIEWQEIKYVFDAEGRLVDAVPHTQGRPYHGSQKLLLVGAKDGSYETGTRSFPVSKGEVYGLARIATAARGGYVLKIANQAPIYKCTLNSPEYIDFADFKSFSADVLLSSESTTQMSWAGLDYHTTIPEQPPGLSWGAQIVIRRNLDGNVLIMGQYYNRNMGIYAGDNLGPAQLDRWYNLRLDIVTKRDDGSLQDNEFRLDYYVDGVFKVSRIPEDSELLLDPNRTGAGPHRSLFNVGDEGPGTSIGYYDSVRGVYRNRIG